MGRGERMEPPGRSSEHYLGNNKIVIRKYIS